MEKLLILLSLLISSQIFAQDHFPIRPAHTHSRAASLYCKDGKALIKVSGYTTSCYHPGQAYISKFEIIKLVNLYAEDIMGRRKLVGAKGKILVEANNLGYRYRCDNPRGMPYSRSVELPVIPGSWSIEMRGQEYKLEKGHETCKINK